MRERAYLSADQKAEIARRYADGETSTTLSLAFGTSFGNILNIVRAHGGTIRSRRRLTPEQQEWTRNAYAGGMSSLKVAAALGVNKRLILDQLKSDGIPRRSMSEAKRKYPLDESLFDQPTAAGRYWIGVLMTDGCVHWKRAAHTAIVSLGFAYRDVGHVEKFRTFLGTEQPLFLNPEDSTTTFTMNGKPYESTKHGRAEISVASVRLAEALARYGVVPRKKHGATVSLLENDRDFWRGAIDGDGTVGMHRDGKFPFLGFYGSKPLVTQFSRYLGTIGTKREPSVRPTGSIWCCTISGGHAAEAVRHLYDGCAVALDRKMAVAERVMAWKRIKGGLPQ